MSRDPVNLKAPAKPRSYAYAPPMTPLDVVFADDNILVLNKPAGLLTVAGKSADLADCLEARAQAEFPTAQIIHRLDKDTSGMIILGLTRQAHAHIGLQFEKRLTRKTYHALVWGQPEEDEGFIDAPIKTDWYNRPKQCVSHEGGRPAQTGWRVLERAEHARILLTPLTGRTHQLRVHMAHIGHPILGDNLYAHEAALDAAPRLCLHARTLGFAHPATGAPMDFESAVGF